MRADDMLNIRGVTLFPSAEEDVVRRVGEVGEEFQIVLSRTNDPDVLTVQVEVRPDVPVDKHAAVIRKVQTEIISRCERREVEALACGTLPKTEFKAKRV